jgi:hypothetical protein
MNNHTLGSLNDALFEQLKKLQEADEASLAFEAEKAKHVALISKMIIENGRLVLDAATRVSDLPAVIKKPTMLEG